MTNAEPSPALLGLRDELVTAARSIQGPAATDQAGPMAAAGSGLPIGGGLAITGEQPDVLSKEARTTLVKESRQLAGGTIAAATLLGLLEIGLTSMDDDLPAWVVAIPIALLVVGVLLWFVAYLTVMGFGKVSIGLEVGDTGSSESGDDEGGGEPGAEPEHGQGDAHLDDDGAGPQA